jgi:hypothetical protein
MNFDRSFDERNVEDLATVYIKNTNRISAQCKSKIGIPRSKFNVRFSFIRRHAFL